MRKSGKKKGSGLVVHEPVAVAIEDLSFAEYNPRVISKEEMASLKASLRKHGLVMNFVVQRRSEEHGRDNVVIGGHQRLRAVREICEEEGIEVPARGWAVVLDVDDREARHLNVALNSISGEWDTYKLGEVFKVLQEDPGLDVSALGFSQEQFGELVRGATESIEEEAARLESEAEEGLSAFAKSITLTVEFSSVEDRDAAKSLLKEQGGMKPGSHVLRLLRAAAPSKASKKKRREKAA